MISGGIQILIGLLAWWKAKSLAGLHRPAQSI
jgi:hypothetical protein